MKRQNEWKISFDSSLNDLKGMITVWLYLDCSPGLEEIASICSSLMPFSSCLRSPWTLPIAQECTLIQTLWEWHTTPIDKIRKTRNSTGEMRETHLVIALFIYTCSLWYFNTRLTKRIRPVRNVLNICFGVLRAAIATFPVQLCCFVWLGCKKKTI